MLQRSINAKLFAVLTAIELNKGRVVAAVEGWVLTSTESVKLMEEVLVVRAKSAEDEGKLPFLLLEIHERPVERRNHVVEAFSK